MFVGIKWVGRDAGHSLPCTVVTVKNEQNSTPHAPSWRAQENTGTLFGLRTGPWERFCSKPLGIIFCGLQNCFNGLLLIVYPHFFSLLGQLS